MSVYRQKNQNLNPLSHPLVTKVEKNKLTSTFLQFSSSQEGINIIANNEFLILVNSANQIKIPFLFFPFLGRIVWVPWHSFSENLVLSIQFSSNLIPCVNFFIFQPLPQTLVCNSDFTPYASISFWVYHLRKKEQKGYTWGLGRKKTYKRTFPMGKITVFLQIFKRSLLKI